MYFMVNFRNFFILFLDDKSEVTNNVVNNKIIGKSPNSHCINNQLLSNYTKESSVYQCTLDITQKRKVFHCLLKKQQRSKEY